MSVAKVDGFPQVYVGVCVYVTVWFAVCVCVCGGGGWWDVYVQIVSMCAALVYFQPQQYCCVTDIWACVASFSKFHTQFTMWRL